MNHRYIAAVSKTIHTTSTKTPKRFHSWISPSGCDTGIKVYNCVAKENTPVILRNKNFATWYTCGPTVYAPSHLGHASCYVKVDIIQRILRNYFNINLVTAMNITDIDDKIIKQCNQDISWQDVARENEASFWDDLKGLNVMEPDLKLKVSDHIPHIIVFIVKLVDSDMAYIGKDSSVYFKLDKYRGYGKLQKVSQQVKAEHEVKEAVSDFVLWKAAKPNEPSWKSPWGVGRPGWHIECSTMASRIFGESVDFHAGGLDLRFPHHENEETQSCAFHNKPQWVNYWLHTGQLFVKGDTEKMSKSLQNTVSIREFLDENSPEDFRMACVLSNYRNSMVYSNEMLQTAQNTLQVLISFISDCEAYIEGKKPQGDMSTAENLKALFETEELVDNALRFDFDTAKCISHLIHFASCIGKTIHSNVSQQELVCSSNVDSVIAARNFCLKILTLFGFKVKENRQALDENSVDIDTVLENLLIFRKRIRDQAKSTKSSELFRISDELRHTLEASGVEVKDHEKGSTWRFLKK